VLASYSSPGYQATRPVIFSSGNVAILKGRPLESQDMGTEKPCGLYTANDNVAYRWLRKIDLSKDRSSIMEINPLQT